MIRSLSLRTANLLYLITILLIITLGSLMQSATFSWGLLGTELLLILAPTLFFLRRAGLPLRETLRLNPISIWIGLSALMIGAGAWLVDALLSGILAQLTGYSVSLGPGSIPSNGLDAGLVALSFCIAAPVCEEILFRGAILGSYLSVRSTRAAVIITGLMFAFYHLQLQGLVALLPIAFAVTYTAWRANSLYASMLVHFANNALATFLLLMYSFRPDIQLPFPSLPASGIGILLLVAGVILLNRVTARLVHLAIPASPASSQTPQSSQDLTTSRSTWIARYWPLLAAALVYVVMAGVELSTYARPEQAAKTGLALKEPAGWSQPADFTYQIRNKADQPVGELTCHRIPFSETFNFNCQAQVEPYQVTVNGGQWMSSGAQLAMTASWARPDLQMTAMDGKMTFVSGGWYSWTVIPGNGQLRMVVKENDGEGQEQLLPKDVWINYEWPLRLMAADFQVAQANRVDLAWQNTFRPETRDSGPVAKPAVLVVRGVEKVGQWTAWRVTVDKFTLWYAVDEPHSLLKYDDGFEIYVLKN